MAKGVESFERQLDGPLAELPVLATADPKTFVRQVLDLPPRSFRAVMKALKKRYANGYLRTSLRSEQAWLQAVREELVEGGGALNPIAKYRVNSAITYCIDPYLKEEDV
jgi:hypothetical protein